MIFTNAIVTPKSAESLRKKATEFREKYDLINPYIDVPRLVGYQMQKDTTFYVDVRPDDEFPHPHCDPDGQFVYLPDSVHDAMLRGDGFARESVMKCVAHCQLHTQASVIIPRTTSRFQTQCSNWQASLLAAEILGHHEYVPLAKDANDFAQKMGITKLTAARLWKHYEDAGLLQMKRGKVELPSFDHCGGGR